MGNIHTLNYRVDVPEGSIYAKKWMPKTIKDKTPIVLLHDSLGCIGLWKEFPKLLAEHLGREVIAYHRLGFGESSPRE